MSMLEQFEKLEPRERTLLTVLAGVFGSLILLVIPVLLWSMVSSQEDENQEIRDVIATIEESREKIAERKADRDALLARYAQKAPPVAGLIEDAARQNGISLAESQNRPDIPHGKRYTERLTVVKLRKVGLLALSKTLERIAQSPYPVSITRLNIKPRGGEPDQYDVELGVSAYDRKEEKPKKDSEASEEDASDDEKEEEK